jgi:hypothetical protein
MDLDVVSANGFASAFCRRTIRYNPQPARRVAQETFE